MQDVICCGAEHLFTLGEKLPASAAALRAFKEGRRDAIPLRAQP